MLTCIKRAQKHRHVRIHAHIRITHEGFNNKLTNENFRKKEKEKKRIPTCIHRFMFTAIGIHAYVHRAIYEADFQNKKNELFKHGSFITRFLKYIHAFSNTNTSIFCIRIKTPTHIRTQPTGHL